MRLGELLVALGALEVTELEAALERQAVVGGRLGTSLVELGYVSSDAVGHALARLRGVPAALTKHFAAIDPRAVATLSREIAAREVAVPIAFSNASGRRLVVCMRDPTNTEARAAIERAVDLEVVVAVAPELALHAALERHYRVRRPQRFVDATAPVSAAGEDLDIDIDLADLDGELDMPAALELVDLDHSDVARSEPLRVDTRQTPPPLSMVGRDRSPRPDATASPATNPSANATPAPASTPSANATPPPATSAPAATSGFAPRALSADAAARFIAAAGKRSEVSEAVLAYLHGHFDAGLMLIVKQGLALGYRGFGGRITPETVETIVVPLSLPSILGRAVQRRALTRLDPAETQSAVQDRFYKLFPGEPVRDAVAVPLATSGRIISIIYAHGTIDTRNIAGLVQVAAATEDAFLRLIRAAR